MALTEELQSILRSIVVAPWRLSLETPGIQATVPMLRGVWGAALHELDAAAYEAVFVGQGPPHDRTPGYILRPAAPDPEDAPALDWILLGPAASYRPSLMRAWDLASGMGLGPERQRFIVRRFRPLDPAGKPLSQASDSSGWTLNEAAWPVDSAPGTCPCRLRFPSPLRILRKHQLIDQPTIPDLVVSACRRAQPFLPPAEAARLEESRPSLLKLAQAVSARPWQGERLDMVRYSGRQKRELDLHGVTGTLDLPDGPGELWPLLAAAQWLHLGKGTALGMGQLLIGPLDD